MGTAMHPNLFPGAAAVTVEAHDDANSAADHAASRQSPWSNSFARRTADESASAKSATAEGAPPATAGVEKKPTRAQQVIAHLRESGPSTSAELCRALGISNKGGIGPFIGTALQNGQIIRIDGKYTLPAAPGSEIAEVPAAPLHQPERKTKQSPAPAPREVAPSPREMPTPDLVLFVDELQLLAYADGSIVLQNAQARIEVRPRQMRAFLVLAQLRD